MDSGLQAVVPGMTVVEGEAFHRNPHGDDLPRHSPSSAPEPNHFREKRLHDIPKDDVTRVYWPLLGKERFSNATAWRMSCFFVDKEMKLGMKKKRDVGNEMMESEKR